MRTLFLGQERNLNPWYSDVVAASAERIDLRLYDRKSPLAPQFDGIEAIVDQGGVVGTREMVDLAANAGIKLWQVLGTGLDHVDVEYILSRNLALCNTPGQFSAIALAEHAMFQMLFFAKNFPASQESVRAGILCSPMVEEVGGMVLGLVGFGASGRELTVRARAFGMRIHAVDVATLSTEAQKNSGLEWYADPTRVDVLFRTADYISLHVPLTERTRHLIDARALALMKPTATLINVARGGIVDESALYDALVSGRLRGAALDVFSEEPLDPSHPLLQLPNVLATPHLAGVTTGTSRRRASAVVENLVRVANNEEPHFRITARD